MFTSTERFGFFDYFRVPYGIATDPDASLPADIGGLRPTDRESGPLPWLYWWRKGAASHHSREAGRYTIAGFTLVAPVLRDFAPELADSLGTGWRALQPILDQEGSTVASVWVDQDGSVFLPFDPAEAMTSLWSEAYTRLGRGRWSGAVRGGLVKTYYTLRPLLPRVVQIRLRQGYAAHNELPDFPSWPLESSLHDLYDWLFGLLSSLAGEPVPYLSPWPAGKESALVLTHDVETAVGRDNIEKLRAAERAHGFRSSWNFVPLRYDVADAVLEGLREEGCEIGVHGLRHDGKDLASRRMLRKRLPVMREYAEKWGAVGFRSPATQRIWALMPTLGFDYDSSYHDTAPHEPQPGGSCTWFPFFNEQQVELPMTLPMDHTLFEILGHADGTAWREKAEELRRRGGMVLVLVHPDYVTCPGLLEAWEDLLAQFTGDESVWQALPKEVSSWWRRRAESSLTWDGAAWSVEGPAASDAEIRFGATQQGRSGNSVQGEGEPNVDHRVAG
jgi:hypothetical protein